MGFMPEGFPVCNVGDMHLHHGGLHRLYGVPDPDRGMGVGRRIEDDPIIRKTHFLYFVDQLPFYIGLEIIQLDFPELELQLAEKVLKGLVPVKPGLPLSQEVKVRSVDDN